MPQVARPVIKERAARLREKGAVALTRHLDGEIGARRSVLVETRELGRTEHFTPVRLKAAEEVGGIVDIAVAGHDGHRLLAV
jgi:threonylcarbamoyladenosine tRNA methylthiotransferase MtaB